MQPALHEGAGLSTKMPAAGCRSTCRETQGRIQHHLLLLENPEDEAADLELAPLLHLLYFPSWTDLSHVSRLPQAAAPRTDLSTDSQPLNSMESQNAYQEDDASSQALLKAEEGQQGAHCPVTQPPSILEHIWSEIV